MAVTDLEETVLRAPRNHLLAHPGVCAEFAAEYARHMNQLRATHDAARAQQRAEFAKVTRDLDRLVQALLDGVRGSRVKEKWQSWRLASASSKHPWSRAHQFTRTWASVIENRSRV
jgi:hypothetical protein